MRFPKPLVAVFLAGAISASVAADSRAQGQAYFSFQGWFTAGTDEQNFLFGLSQGVASPEPFSLRTWHNYGGTNAAGQVIPAGAFDSILKLYDSYVGGTMVALDDDIDRAASNFDAQLTWGSNNYGNEIPLPDPLSAGTYRLQLEAYNDDLPAPPNNHWAVDLVGPADKLVLTGVSAGGSGGSAIDSLIFDGLAGGTATAEIGTGQALVITGELDLGSYGQAVLTSDGGSIVCGQARLGFWGGGSGSVWLSNGAQWRAYRLYLGGAGTGDLNIQGGSLAEVNGNAYLGYYGSANVTVSGLGSRCTVRGDLELGTTGRAWLMILNQGVVDSSTVGFYGRDLIGYGAGAEGWVDVAGSGAEWRTDQLVLGNYGRANLTILDGGKTTSTGAYLAVQSGSKANVTVSGVGTGGPSTWQISGGLYVGGDPATGPGGEATLTVENGGSLTVTGETQVWGGGGVAAANVNVTGNGSSWQAGAVTLQSGGVVKLSQGATIQSGSVLLAGVSSGIIIDGYQPEPGPKATWTIDGSLSYDPLATALGAVVIQNAGRMIVDQSVRVRTAHLAWPSLLSVQSNGELRVGGEIVAENGTVVGLQTGSISTGSLIIQPGASFTHTDGVLEVNGGQFDPGTPGYSIDGATPTDLPTIKLLGGATATLLGTSGIPLSPALTLANANRGALEVRGGSRLTCDAEVLIAGQATSTGGSTLTIAGLGSVLAFNGELWRAYLGVGDYGKGSLVVSEAGQVMVPPGGSGTDGSTLSIGDHPGSSGEVIVEGSGSRIGRVLNLVVGNSGSGVLRIRDGGAVSSVSQGAIAMRVIGNMAGSVGLVDVTGVAADGTRSMLTIDAADPTYPAGLVVGRAGLGTLAISDGAFVSSHGGQIASTATAAGSWASVGGWNVTDPPAQWDLSDSLFVGGSDTAPGGSGLLLVYHGGLVTVAFGKTLKVWNTGSVELYDGQISTGSFVNSGGSFLHEDGLLEVNGGLFDPGTPGYTIDGGAPGNLPTIRPVNGATGNLPSGLIVGNNNAGALEIRSGSQLTCSGAVIGVQPTSTSGSTVTVDGPASLWNLNELIAGLTVGSQGKGLLTVSGGGQVVLAGSSGNLHSGLTIGAWDGAQGEVLVDSKDSRISNVGIMSVGMLGSGALRIRNGGSVAVTGANIFIALTGAGAVEVTGTAPDGTRSSCSAAGAIHVGHFGPASLDVSNGALLSSRGGQIAAYAGPALSRATVGGYSAGIPAEWLLDDSLYVAGTDTAAGGNGVLRVSEGGFITIVPGKTLKVWNTGAVELLGGGITTGSFVVESGGAFLHENGVLEVVGGLFDPGTVGHAIDGPTANELPTVKLRDGATAGFAAAVVVGDAHVGSLQIRSGSVLNSGSGMIGFQPSSIGSRVIVAGASGSGTRAQWVLGDGLYVGGSPSTAGGQGTLSIATGGSVNAGGPVKVWPLGMIAFQDGDLTAPFVDLSGGRFSGYGILRSRVQSANGTIDTPNPGDRLTLGNRLEIMPGSTLQKTGAGNLILARTQTWNSGAEFDVVAGAVDYLLSAPATVFPGAMLNIQPGATVNAGGLFDPFTDAGDTGIHVDVLNEDAFNITAASKGIGQLTGAGTTTISGGATLTADYVKQGSVLLAGTSGQPAKLVIRPSGGGAMFRVGTAGNSPAPVPEPAVLWLLAAAGLCFYLLARRGRPGRGFSAAEMRYDVNQVGRGHRASMGPRLFSRGNFLAVRPAE